VRLVISPRGHSGQRSQSYRAGTILLFAVVNILYFLVLIFLDVVEPAVTSLQL